MDLDQSNSDVSNTLTSWVSGYVSEYSIDGFRLDASKHMPLAWQSGFCKTAGIFCMGEVAGDDTAYDRSVFKWLSAECISGMLALSKDPTGLIPCMVSVSSST